MFHWLFPNWSTPGMLVALVGIRFVLNCGLVAVVARATGSDSAVTIIEAILTLTSAAMTVLLLRETLGLNASYVEFLVQLAIIVIAGYTAYSARLTRFRVALTGVCLLGSVLFLLFMIPIYGEAFVAP